MIWISEIFGTKGTVYIWKEDIYGKKGTDINKLVPIKN